MTQFLIRLVLLKWIMLSCPEKSMSCKKKISHYDFRMELGENVVSLGAQVKFLNGRALLVMTEKKMMKLLLPLKLKFKTCWNLKKT